ncbi:chitinase 3-like, partial [Sparus aurata]|uniref:chitinase 3-like n=1 Tax=Sparus aurata TaxID=8175 RepID=UPI0011C12E9C
MWKIEPQLEDPSEDKNMKVSTRCKLYRNQAGERDYRIKKKKNNIKEEFDKGHLFPSSYGHTENDKKSTFTLTNIVPQAGPFNKGSWNRMEQCIKCVMDDYCINNNGQVEGFLVIGVQPGNNKLNNRVNIPSMLWSAFCCYSRSKGWLASAHWGQNIPDGDGYLQMKTLDELNNKLSTTRSEFEVFPGTQCPNNATVTQFYQDINSKSEGRCNCPSLISTTSAAPTTTSTPPDSTTVPFTTTSALPSSTSVPLSTTPETTTSASPETTTGHATTTSSPSTTDTTHTTPETPTTPTSIHPTTTFPTTTRPQTETTPPPTTVQTTTTKTTTATTSTTTTTTTTTTKKK